MAGLLDFLNTPQGMGLLSGVASYAANARRGAPVNSIGRGLAGGIAGYSQAQDQIRQDQENAFQNQYRQMQMNDMQRKLAEQQAQKAWKADYVKKATPQVAQFEADNQFGEDLGNLQTVNQPDPEQIRQHMMQPDSPYFDKMVEMQLPKSPKWSIGERFNENTGMREKVLYDENNPADVRPFGGTEADTIVADNLGGQTIYRGSHSATPQSVVRRTVSPDSVLSAQTAMRGQDISNANAAASRAVTIRGQDMPPKAAKGGPMSVTLQKELLESDDTVQGSKAVIDTLQNALAINKNAYSGYGAKPRAILRSNLPGESEAANATINIDNMMTGQALESLKLVFGGMPTEGERKILLDMQASVDKTPAQREAIMNRAIAAAKRRGEFAARKAQAIRSGTYLNEGVPDTPAPAAVSAKPAQSFSLPPNAKQYAGKTITDTQTGRRFKSDGTKWVPQ